MGVPRTLAKGLSKLKEAAELRKLGGTQAERMARAAEQGYDISHPVYHGTATDFQAFDPERAIGTQFWSTTDRAAIEAGDVGAAGKGVIKEMYHRIQNPAGWAEYDKYGIDELQRMGYDGLALPDADGHITYNAFSPNQYRDVNADFNPEYRDSPNLLAGIAGAMPYAGATAALLAGATPQEAEAGPLQTFGRAAPYLTSTALGGAAALQSPEAESFVTQPAIDPSYEAYIRDAMEARTAADKFTQMRGSKAGYWEARRQELLEMVNGLGEMANNVVLPALDKPLQGYLGLAGTAGALAQGLGLEQALIQGANIVRQPSDQTTYNMGGAVTDTLSPYTTPEAAAAAGALTNAGIQMLSPI